MIEYNIDKLKYPPTICHTHSHVDIDTLIMTHHIVHIAAVHLRHLTKSHRTGLDDEVVDGHLRRFVIRRGRRSTDGRDVLIQLSTKLSMNKKSNMNDKCDEVIYEKEMFQVESFTLLTFSSSST